MNRSSKSAARVRKVMAHAQEAAQALPESQRDLFKSFAQSVVIQLREPYIARHTIKRVPHELREAFELLYSCGPAEIQTQLRPLGAGGMVLRTNMADQPFIVDTIRLLLDSVGAQHESGFNAVLPIGRDENGCLLRIGDDNDPLESVTEFEITGLGDTDLKALEQTLQGHMRLARVMVRDFGSITTAVDRVAGRFSRLATRQGPAGEHLQEAAEFMRWLLTDNFVFMGAVDGEGRFGFESQDMGGIWASAGVPEDSDCEWGDLPIQVVKGSRESPVHRAGRVDEIRVRVPDESGSYSHVMVLRGMFTFRAVTQPSRSVPILRRMLAQMLANETARPGSWRYKGVANVFDSLPTEYLFTAEIQEVSNMVDRVLDAEAGQLVQVFLVQKLGITFVLLAMPRAHYAEETRRRMEDLLHQATGATYSDHGVLVGRYHTVLVHYYLTGARTLTKAQSEDLHAQLVEIATPWDSRLFGVLTEAFSEERAEQLFARYSHAFEADYQAWATPKRARRDISHLELLTAERPVTATVFEYKGDLYLRLYQIGNIILSDALPVLDNFGLVVIDQFADHVGPADRDSLDMDTFRLQGAFGLEPAQILERSEQLVHAIEAVFTGQCQDDRLNGLVLRAGLNWKDVDLIRAYRGHLNQLGLRLTGNALDGILLRHPKLVGKLRDVFHARFDPGLSDSQRKRAMSKTADAVEDGLRRVHDGDEDYALRSFFRLIQGTVRTNFFRTDLKAWYISYKIDHALLKGLVPEPRLMYEIYVHHPEMEGLHFRGGPVARGGLRWSDRLDYRIEVMGLVTTQMVKNVVIVPEGAKGGFRIKRSIADRGERRRVADELYKWFIRGLLDVTDNYVGQDVVNPPNVVFHDGGKDPYLVVAADKGTAHLSDTANGVAVDEYDFWLGDAFASGGSQGYDHKKCGITARGAWECVKRHFQEMGLDPQTEEFSAIGIGDTGGDVFGNGVIEFPTMRLRAAFNHLHIFLDPDPNAEVSYKERKRLFKAVKGWDAYDTGKLSEGGGVYDRSAKVIRLSPQAKVMLGAVKDEMEPEAVIRLILRLEVDLLWCGGIGTYFKASWETHKDADDPPNDRLRINANELRARAIGEGANLSFTAAARAEYARSGGRLNTDFVDNSGGVDMSDHEVNLKILLGGLVREERLTVPERNKLISDLTRPVTRFVLANNDAHARQISIEQLRSLHDPFRFGRAIGWIQEQGSPNRARLTLPGSDELQRRQNDGKGLLRSELAVLSSHVKMHVYRQLQDADPSWIPDFDQRLLGYFPKRIRESYPAEVQGHMLAKEIGMTVALTETVADMGATFFPMMLDLNPRHPGEIMGGWLRGAKAFRINALRAALNNTGAPLETRYEAWLKVTEGMMGLSASWMSPGASIPDMAHLERSQSLLSKVNRQIKALSSYDGSGIQSLVNKGLPQPLAAKVFASRSFTYASEIISLMKEGDSERDAIVRYLAIGEASGILGAVSSIESRAAAGKWDTVAMGMMRNRFLSLLRQVVQTTTLQPADLRMSTERLAHRLKWGELKAMRQSMDAVLARANAVGAYLVAEERVRALLQG